jgi:hypothetical protein
MGKSTPDFGDIAASQGEENEKVIRDQTYANRPGQVTPWGGTNWTTESVIDPATGQPVTKWTQTQSLSPEAQKMLDQQMAIGIGKGDVAGSLVGRMGSEFGAPVDWSGLSPMGGVPEAQFTRPTGDVGDPNEFRQRAEDAMYQKAQSRLAPQYDAKRQALEVKLRNQGLNPEDAAYKSQMEGLGRQESDAYDQAMWGATAAGRSESDSMFGQQLQRGDQAFGQSQAANQQNYQQMMQGSAYANQIRQQQMTEEMQKRGFSLNEINALLSGQQVQNPQMPNFSQAASAAPAPIYQGAVDTSNAKQAQAQGVISGVTDLAGAGMGMYGMMNQSE